MAEQTLDSSQLRLRGEWNGLEEFGTLWIQRVASIGKITILVTPYKRKGVYAFRSKLPLPRRVGNSDILYIGSTDNLVQRIFGNYLGGVGGETTQRIHKLLFEEGYLEKAEIGWTVAENPKELEKELRMKFE